MTSAWLLNASAQTGLQSLNLSRHLTGIADVIEVCFGHEMDGTGRAAVREMREFGQLGLLIAPLTWFGWAPPPWKAGFVWLEAGQVVGCVSTQPSAADSATWIVANVAVHPNHRRRGLAFGLMRATLDLIRHAGGRRVSLQVDDDNLPAQALYRQLGFAHVATHSTWVRSPGHNAPAAPELPGLRQPASGEWADEWALARTARPEGLAWNRPLRPADFAPRFGLEVERWLAGQSREHWLAPRPAGRPGLAAALLVHGGLPEGDRLTVLVHPDARGTLEAPLLAHGLRRLGGRAWPVHIEHPAADPAAEAALRALHFERTRTLRWMQSDF